MCVHYHYLFIASNGLRVDDLDLDWVTNDAHYKEVGELLPGSRRGSHQTRGPRLPPPRRQRVPARCKYYTHIHDVRPELEVTHSHKHLP